MSSSNSNYTWQRRWLNINTSNISQKHPYEFDNAGYIVDTEWGPNLVPKPIGLTLEQLEQELKFAVLLGEPGSGKSYEWQKQREALKDSSNHLFLDLGTFPTEDILFREIVNSREVEMWKKDNSVLTLWLDSLDEGLLHINQLQEGIFRTLKALPAVERLRLRITCRNAVWPVAFLEKLLELWGLSKEHSSQQFAMLLLSPLTQQQVKAAAEQEGLNADQFITAIDNVNAQPLASSPVTLRLLINLFKSHKPTFGISETAGRAGLYEHGCLELCEMPDRNRNEQHRVDGRTRMLLAGYLAFLAVLTNRRQISTEPVLGTLGLNELDPFSVGNGLTAAWKGMQAQITALAVRDLLRNTGLFTDVGNGRIVWTHQSYAEFLAAWYLNLTELSPATLRPIFRSAVDPTGGIVPALQETAAWLAELQPTFWNEILELDPLALVQSDLRFLNDGQRSMLVARLITWLSNMAVSPFRDSSERGFMQQLRHPKLADQLATVLKDPSSPGATVSFATSMVFACKVRELVPMLVGQAIDTSLSFSMRSNALYMLVSLTDDDARAALRSLLHLPIPSEDVRDDFRGNLLRILWPSHMNSDELLPLLTQEKEDHYLGSYRFFLNQLEREADIDFSLAAVLKSLRWLAQHLPTIEIKHRREKYRSIINRLVWRRAWQLSEEAGIIEAMADLFIVAEKNHLPLSVDKATKKARLALFERLLRRKDRPHLYSIVSNNNSLPAFLTAEDWNLVYPLINTNLSAPAREWLSRVLMFFLRQMLEKGETKPYSVFYEQLFDAKRRYASCRRALSSWFKVVRLDSEEAMQGKEETLEYRERERAELWSKRMRRKLTLREVNKGKRRIQQILEKETAAVSFHEWFLLLHYMSSKRGKTGLIAYGDISQSKYWARLSTVQRTRMIDLACNLVSRYHVPPKEWYTLSGSVSVPSISLYRALLLCQSQQIDFLLNRSKEFWENWACFLVQLDSFGNENKYELTKLAASAAPAAIDTAIYLQADAQLDRQDGSVYGGFSEWFRVFPEARFSDLMLKAIKHGVWREDSSSTLLINILSAGYQPAWDYAIQLLPDNIDNQEAELERPNFVVAVYSWLLFSCTTTRPNSWFYWERLSNRPDLAETIIKKHINRYTRGDLQYLAMLDEEQLHTIILWLTYAYQLSPEDVDYWEDAYPKGSFLGFRAEASSELASRGTASAWEILNQLSCQMGEPFWLRFRIDQVRENLRRNSWDPIAPDALIELSKDASRRWVRSAKDLQELILESLKRFQADLHNEVIAAEVLWMPIKEDDKRKTAGYKVRDENFLSNVIRRHLIQDLQRTDILVKREVEIRPPFGSGTGQRTDLFVEAFSCDNVGSKTSVATVVIEVKLSKNKEVDTAINTQLVPYLAEQKYKHGIYLVGWHYGEHDPKPASLLPLSDLHSLLKQQTETANHNYSLRTQFLDIRLPADAERTESEKPLFEPI